VNCSLEPGICPSCIHSVKKAQEDMKEVKWANTYEFCLERIPSKMTRLLTRGRKTTISLFEPCSFCQRKLWWQASLCKLKQLRTDWSWILRRESSREC
jgi:hypothetical protein